MNQDASEAEVSKAVAAMNTVFCADGKAAGIHGAPFRDRYDTRVHAETENPAHAPANFAGTNLSAGPRIPRQRMTHE